MTRCTYCGQEEYPGCCRDWLLPEKNGGFEAYNPRHPVDCTCRECKWWWAGLAGRMQKSPVTSASSTGLFLDWSDQPMLPYLDSQNVRLVGYVCPEDSYSRGAGSEASPLHFTIQGGD